MAEPQGVIEPFELCVKTAPQFAGFARSPNDVNATGFNLVLTLEFR
jgi:hypothetical protein